MSTSPAMRNFEGASKSPTFPISSLPGIDPRTHQSPYTPPPLPTGGVMIQHIIGWSHNPLLDYDLSLPWDTATINSVPVPNATALAMPATIPPMPFLQIGSPSLPWVLDIVCETSANFVTILDVLSQLYTRLRVWATETEFHMVSSRSQNEIAKAFRLRVDRDLRTAAAEKKEGLRRIDFLKGNNRFLGLSSTKLGPNIWTLHVGRKKEVEKFCEESRKAEKQHLEAEILEEELPPPYPTSDLPLFDTNDDPHGTSAVTTHTSKLTQQELTHARMSNTEVSRSDVAISPSETGGISGLVQVTSNVILANDAFKHVVSCFDGLVAILSQAGILLEDFTVEVGFLQERRNCQGVYFSCQKTLPEELAELLIDIFHPFPYVFLPLSESGGETTTNLQSYPPHNVLSGAQDKGKQRDVSSEGSNGSGSGSGGDGYGGSGSGGSGSGSNRGSGGGGSGSGPGSGGGSGGSGGGGGGDGGGQHDQEEDQLSCDFVSTVNFQDVQGVIQTIKMRADMVTKILSTRRNPWISVSLSKLAITTAPAVPFSLNHFVVEIDPGKSTENVRNPKPTNDLSERIKFITTKEVSATGTASLTSWFQMGGKRSTQQDRYWQPIQWKYLENLDDSDEKHLTALWEFCYKDKPDSFDLPNELLTRAEFHVSNDPWPSIAITIACYYSQRPTTLSLLRRRGGTVGWRDVCHSTRIVMPIVEWPNHEKFHRLHLTIPADPTEVVFKDYTNTEGEAQKLIFRTSAECKTFVRQKSSHPCESRGHGRGPQVNSM